MQEERAQIGSQHLRRIRKRYKIIRIVYLASHRYCRLRQTQLQTTVVDELGDLELELVVTRRGQAHRHHTPRHRPPRNSKEK